MNPMLSNSYIVFKSNDNNEDVSYDWEKFEKWSLDLLGRHDAHSVLGTRFMEYQCPPLITTLMSATQLLSSYHSDHVGTLNTLRDRFAEAVSLSTIDCGVRTKHGKSKRWSTSTPASIYLTALYESWGTNAFSRAFELCAQSLHHFESPKKTSRDYVELAIGLLLARDFERFLSQ
jgi:hypothetical protein